MSVASTVTNSDDSTRNEQFELTDTVTLVESNPVDYVSFDLNELLQTPCSYPDFDLKSLLLHSPMGNAILKYYDKNSLLDDAHRKRMVEIIIRHLYQHIIQQ